jgi:hypothetical protein
MAPSEKCGRVAPLRRGAVKRTVKVVRGPPRAGETATAAPRERAVAAPAEETEVASTVMAPADSIASSPSPTARIRRVRPNRSAKPT